jgi:ribosomal protein S18 acetylase RimI-like enzyme
VPLYDRGVRPVAVHVEAEMGMAVQRWQGRSCLPSTTARYSRDGQSRRWSCAFPTAPRTTWRNSRWRYYLQDVLVLPDEQRNGIGRALVQAILDRYRLRRAPESMIR